MDFEGICRSAVCEVAGMDPAKVVDETKLDHLDDWDAMTIFVDVEDATGLDLGHGDLPATFGALVAQVRAQAAVQA